MMQRQKKLMANLEYHRERTRVGVKNYTTHAEENGRRRLRKSDRHSQNKTVVVTGEEVRHDNHEISPGRPKANVVELE